MPYEQGEKVIEGKTKIVHQVAGDPTLAILTSKPDITAGDGAKHDILDGKDALANATTCNVFALLKRHGIPVAFRERLDDTSFVAERCEMLPYEVVIRRRAHGSYLKRHPEVMRDTVFAQLVVEWYLKTAGKRWRGTTIPKDDPLIRFERDQMALYGYRANLFRPDLPIDGTEPFLSLDNIPLLGNLEAREQVEEVAERVFSLLEEAWSKLGYQLCDLKIEFGRTAGMRIVVADVIDNDSWRVLDAAGNYVDKQRYRDGEGLEAVLALYREVAKLTAQF